MSKEVAKKEATALAVNGPSQGILEAIAEVQDNVAGMDSFKLPRAKMGADGIELTEGDEPVLELEGVIIHKSRKNVFYAKPYNPSNPTKTPPDCFSSNGLTPDESVEKPVAAKCADCPKAQFGSSPTGEGKACRNLVPLFMLLSDESIMPRQLTITPTSLKFLNKYLLDLTERGINFKKVKTKIMLYKDNPKDTYFKIKFIKGEKLDAQKIANVEFLRNKWINIMENQEIELDQSQYAEAATTEAKEVKDEGRF